jgi:hypothetical protein
MQKRPRIATEEIDIKMPVQTTSQRYSEPPKGESA